MEVVDRLTKYDHFIGFTHPYQAHHLARAYADNVLKLHSLNKAISIDRDAIFLSSFWQELCRVQGISLRMLLAHHPQSDGWCEVVNRGLKCHIRSMCGKSPTKWFRQLSLTEWSYNTTHPTTINQSPYEALYGVPPPIYVPCVPKLISGSCAPLAMGFGGFDM